MQRISNIIALNVKFSRFLTALSKGVFFPHAWEINVYTDASELLLGYFKYEITNNQQHCSTSFVYKQQVGRPVSIIAHSALSSTGHQFPLNQDKITQGCVKIRPVHILSKLLR